MRSSSLMMSFLQERPVFDNNWGFFAMSVRGRTGAQCESHFNALKERKRIDAQILYAIAHPYGNEEEAEDTDAHEGVEENNENGAENDENAAPSEKVVVRVKQENEKRYNASSTSSSKSAKKRRTGTFGKKRKLKKRKAAAPSSHLARSVPSKKDASAPRVDVAR